MRTFRKWRMMVTLTILIAMMPLLMGCYGSFPLTHFVYKINGDVTRYPLIHSLVFWAFLIVPVYEVAIIADAVVFNLVEFWTGSAPLEPITTLDQNGNTLTLAPAENGRDAVLTILSDGRLVARERFVRVSDGIFDIRDDHGTRTGRVVCSADGSIFLEDSEGHAIAMSSGQLVAALQHQ